MSEAWAAVSLPLQPRSRARAEPGRLFMRRGNSGSRTRFLPVALTNTMLARLGDPDPEGGSRGGVPGILLGLAL